MIGSVLLGHVSASPVSTLARLRNDEQSVSWLFLGQNYLRFLEWRKVLDPFAESLPTGMLLSQAAEEFRQPFLDLIARLSRVHNSIAWWASRLSERNTLVSPLFLYCCYLKIVSDALENTSGTICVISESWEILESTAEAARSRGYRVSWMTRPIPSSRRVLLVLRIAKRLARFIAMSMNARHGDSGTPNQDAGQPSIFLRTWVDEACFTEDGSFRDRYLPGLCDWLESKGCRVTTIPVLFNLERSNGAAWQWLRHSKQEFLNPFRYYKLADYFFSLKEAWRAMHLPPGSVVLGTLDVSRLFHAERLRGAFDERSLESILSYRLPRRLRERNTRVDLLIDLFENMIPDKLLNLGFRKYDPTARLVGFQHGSLFPLMLCLFVTRNEADLAPMPDRVVCSGDFFRDILVSEGLPAKRAVVGPALRFTHLTNPVEQEAKTPVNESYVLIPLPLVLDSAVELLTKVTTALELIPAIRVLLKPHPMSSSEALLSAAKLKQLPPQFEFVEGTMSQWLSNAKLLIALSSSTILEAFAAGIPVVVVSRETALDINPLGWYADLGRTVRTPEEIRAEVHRIIAFSRDELKAYQIRSREVLKTCFNPVTEESMLRFVEGLIQTASITA